MDRICEKCGKTVQEAGAAFCPFCGHALPAGKAEPERNPEAARMIQKALKTGTLPERKKILEEAEKRFPEDPDIQWELLFIGRPAEKPPRGRIDFSIIKSWLLQIYREPKAFSAAEKDRMRGELLRDTRLERTLRLFPDPEGKRKEYLRRICGEYIEIFLEGDNRVMGTLFGFRLGKNKAKALASPAAEMIRNMREDDGLGETERETLIRVFTDAYAGRAGGSTGELERELEG